MKQFISFIKKEILHIMRDTRTMVIILVIPVIQLFVFGFAISTEIRNTPFTVLDESGSVTASRLIDKLDGNEYFELKSYSTNFAQIEESFREGSSKMAVIFPAGFGNDIYHTGGSDIQVVLDASDPNEATTIGNYVQLVIMQYQQELVKTDNLSGIINTNVKMLYNPQMKSAYNFVPGLMGMILMLICAMMTSISIVREKETGTMEILLVSPIKPIYIVLAKAVPYFIISMIDVCTILLMSVFVFDVPVEGSILLILLLSTVFTLSALSLGLLISSVTETQQAAMIISGVGLMLPTMLLSGLVFPIEGMPGILQFISNFIPARWFIEAIRDIMIKGLGFGAIWKECLLLLLMTVFLLIVCIKKFKTRL